MLTTSCIQIYRKILGESMRNEILILIIHIGLNEYWPLHLSLDMSCARLCGCARTERQRMLQRPLCSRGHWNILLLIAFNWNINHCIMLQVDKTHGWREWARLHSRKKLHVCSSQYNGLKCNHVTYRSKRFLWLRLPTVPKAWNYLNPGQVLSNDH